MKTEEFKGYVKLVLLMQQAINTSSFLYKEYHYKHRDYIANNIFNPLQISILNGISLTSGNNIMKNKSLKEITLKCNNDLKLMIAKLKGLRKDHQDIIYNDATKKGTVLVETALKLYKEGKKAFR